MNRCKKTKRLVLVILFSFLFADNYFSQVNLVPNWSFEDTLTCPTTAGEIDKAPPWFNPTLSTPDYYNSCNGSSVGVPYHGSDYQPARTGNAYAGIWVYQMGTDYREYIEVKLIDSLDQGKKYCVSFYVNLAGNVAPIDALHALLSIDTTKDYSTILNLPYT